MNVVTSAAIRHLKANGYRVMSMADPPDSKEAAALLRGMGYQVFPPYTPPMVGSSWMPMRGKPFSLVSPRVVVEVTAAEVAYQTGVSPGDAPHKIGLRSWQNWVRRARAKMLP